MLPPARWSEEREVVDRRGLWTSRQVSAMSRRHGISNPLLFDWRRSNAYPRRQRRQCQRAGHNQSLGIDLVLEPLRARNAVRSHIDRANWMVTTGARQLFAAEPKHGSTRLTGRL